MSRESVSIVLSVTCFRARGVFAVLDLQGVVEGKHAVLLLGSGDDVAFAVLQSGPVGEIMRIGGGNVPLLSNRNRTSSLISGVLVMVAFMHGREAKIHPSACVPRLCLYCMIKDIIMRNQ
jgi:hypothetical protein